MGSSHGGCGERLASHHLALPLRWEDQFNPTESPAGFDFAWPENFNYEIVFDETTGLYSIQQRIGDTLLYRPSTFLTLDEYLDYDITGNLIGILDRPPSRR